MAKLAVEISLAKSVVQHLAHRGPAGLGPAA